MIAALPQPSSCHQRLFACFIKFSVLTHFTPSQPHSFIHTFIRSFIHPSMHACMYQLVYSFVHSFICLFIVLLDLWAHTVTGYLNTEQLAITHCANQDLCVMYIHHTTSQCRHAVMVAAIPGVHACISLSRTLSMA